MKTSSTLKSAIDKAFKGDNKSILEYRRCKSKNIKIRSTKYSSLKDKWEQYKKTTEYNTLLASMKGIKEPYNENIMWYAFTAGYNCKK